MTQHSRMYVDLFVYGTIDLCMCTWSADELKFGVWTCVALFLFTLCRCRVGREGKRTTTRARRAKRARGDFFLFLAFLLGSTGSSNNNPWQEIPGCKMRQGCRCGWRMVPSNGRGKLLKGFSLVSDCGSWKSVLTWRQFSMLDCMSQFCTYLNYVKNQSAAHLQEQLIFKEERNGKCFQ